MKKRISALLLSVVLCLGMLGMTAGAFEAKGTAGETTIQVTGVSGKKTCALWGDAACTKLLLLFETDEQGKAPVTVDAALSASSEYYTGVAGETAKKVEIASASTDPGDRPSGGGGGGGGSSSKPSIKPGTGTPSVPRAVSFNDVASGAWYAGAVAYVAERGIMNGTGNGNFSPNATTTRAMIMTMLARLNGVNTDGGSVWYEKGMQWAVAQGVSDGSNPNGAVTREQLVTMLYRYMGSPEADGDLSRFHDAATVNDWALDAMKWAVANGLIQGDNTGAIHPRGNATRAEVATILMRFCETFAV